MKIDPDALAQFIRSVDGNNTMGAGALAERICEWLDPQLASSPLISGCHLDVIEAKVYGLDPEAESCVSNSDVLKLVSAIRTLQVREHLI